MGVINILFIGRSLPFHQVGGMEAVVWDLARALVRRGAAVDILTTACPALPERSVQEGVVIQCMPGTEPGRYSRAYWRESWRIFRDQYLGRSDVVMGCGGGALSVAGWAATLRRRPALFMQAHGTSWDEFLSKWRTPSLLDRAKSVKQVAAFWHDRTYRHFDELIAVGHAVASSLQSLPTRLIVGRTPVTTILNGIDEEAFAFDPVARARKRAEHGIPERAPVVLSASRLHIQKGIAQSLEGIALARERTPGLTYAVVGEGPEERKLREQVRSLGLQEAVRFVGPVSRPELAAYLSMADLFLLTSLRIEGLPMAPLEAMANGLPCVLSRHIAHPDLPATAVHPREPREIADAIVRSLSAPRSDRTCRLPATHGLTSTAEKYLERFRAARAAV